MANISVSNTGSNNLSNGKAGSSSVSSRDLSSSNAQTVTERLQSEPTTVDSLTGSPTTQDNLSGGGGSVNAKDVNSAAVPGLFKETKEIASSSLATAAATVVSAVTPLSYEEAKEFLSENQSASDAVFQTTADGVETTIGSYNIDYKTPHASRKVNKGSVSAGELKVEGTAYQKSSTMNIIDTSAVDTVVNADLRVGAASANAGAKASYEIGDKKMSASVDINAGAEVMGVDGKLGGTISVSTQGMVDTFVDAYNGVVDPVHEAIVGHEVPDMADMDLPDALDRSVTLSRYVEVGFGVALKGGGDASVSIQGEKAEESGKGKDADIDKGIFSANGHFKAGIGSVVGAGGGIVIK